jgi:hypothetical protein
MFGTPMTGDHNAKYRDRGVLRIGVAALMMAGEFACSRNTGTAQSYSVDYYRTHPADRETRVKVCGRDSARAEGDSDCINADQAERLEAIGHLRALPRLKLQRDPSQPREPSPAGR